MTLLDTFTRSVIILSVVYVECRKKLIIQIVITLSVIMLSFIILSVIMLSAVMLIVIMLSVLSENRLFTAVIYFLTY